MIRFKFQGVIFDERAGEEERKAMGTGTPDLWPQQDTMRNIPKSVGSQFLFRRHCTKTTISWLKR